MAPCSVKAQGQLYLFYFFTRFSSYILHHVPKISIFLQLRETGIKSTTENLGVTTFIWTVRFESGNVYWKL